VDTIPDDKPRLTALTRPLLTPRTSELFQQLEYHLPRELSETKAEIEKRLAA